MPTQVGVAVGIFKPQKKIWPLVQKASSIWDLRDLRNCGDMPSFAG